MKQIERGFIGGVVSVMGRAQLWCVLRLCHGRAQLRVVLRLCHGSSTVVGCVKTVCHGSSTIAGCVKIVSWVEHNCV